MTDTAADVETQAHRFAVRGRDMLVERMRAAYSNAAAAQADLITLDNQHIETMVQAATDRADGLQWRRALAAVAAEELGISATEALSHAAVIRAQALVGAPSYEQSLAEIIARPVPPAPPTPTPTATPPVAAPAATPVAAASVSSTPNFGPTEEAGTASAESVPEPESDLTAAEPHTAEHPAAAVRYAEEPSDELETVEADDMVLELLPSPDPTEYESDLEPDPHAETPDSGPVGYAAETADPGPGGDATESADPDAGYETEVYDVEASFIEEPLPPAPTNPFAAQAPPPPEQPAAEQPAAEEPAAEEQPFPEPDVEDQYEPPTQEHQAAGVTAALKAIGVAGSVPDPVHSHHRATPDPLAADDQFVAPHPITAPEPITAAPESEQQDLEVSFPAIHLGGVANLPTKREGLSVRLSHDGLDIMQGPREIVGRLVWEEIESLEVPTLRMRRRQNQVRGRLVVRTPHGDASFEVPDIGADELRERVEPLLRLYGRG